jgi:hypothetical protein
MTHPCRGVLPAWFRPRCRGLRGLQGVAQAHRAYRAASADCLRCADLLQCWAYRRDGKEQIWILALAGAARHSVAGARGGVKWQHDKPPESERSASLDHRRVLAAATP